MNAARVVGERRLRRTLIPRVLLLVGLLTLYVAVAVASSRRSVASMAAAANQFLASLSANQQSQATFAFDSEERLRWHFIPSEMFPRKGLPLKAMTDEQRRLAHELLKTGLSRRGYMTATAVMELERILRALENGRLARDPDEYLFTVFGTPSTDGTWGWRVEGHHVSFHFTVVNGMAVSSAPAFLGANPAEVRSGPRTGFRALAAEEDAARALLGALDARQRATAIIDHVAPADILTEASLDIDPLAPVGIKASELTAAQRDLLMKLIEAYTSLMADDLAAARLARLRDAGLGNITFAWAGEMERGTKHYYRVQGPTFLIEYDNTQNDGNHIHSVWRDFNGDFGRDVLREHLRDVRH